MTSIMNLPATYAIMIGMADSFMPSYVVYYEGAYLNHFSNKVVAEHFAHMHYLLKGN